MLAMCAVHQGCVMVTSCTCAQCGSYISCMQAGRGFLVDDCTSMLQTVQCRGKP